MNTQKIGRRSFLGIASGTLMTAAAVNTMPEVILAGETKKERLATGKYGGVISVMVTPYQKNHMVDREAMNSIARKLVDQKVNGLFVAGSTGDMPMLNRHDREVLLQATKEAIGDRALIYAGITSYSLPDITEYAKRFADRGADVAVLMAPLMFFCFSQEELRAYFTEAADKSPIPILMYHHIKSATPIEPITVKQLADHPNIIGMKETGPSLERTREIYEFIKNKDFVLFQGNEGFVPDSFKMGLPGTMSAMAGVYPEVLVELWQASKKGDETLYAEKSKNLLDMCKVFSLMPRSLSFTYFSYTLKRMLQYRGWCDNTNTRLPGFVPDKEYEKKLLAFLDNIHFPKK